MDGHVTDESGAGVGQASIKVSNLETGAVRTARADGHGEFIVQGLVPGIYRIEVSASGFATEVIQRSEVLVNQQLSPIVKLHVASVQERVDVSSEAAQLQTESSSTGGVVTQREVLDMPINGRNYLDLMQLVPGVNVNRAANEGSDDSTPILGERAGNADFLIDGMPNNDYLNGGAAAQFNQDAILEFQVLTSSYKAEFGHSSGGVINVVSRSGTNDPHGIVSFFHRNYKLDSANTSTNGVPFLLRWDPAAQVGGAIVKDKLFYFVSAERIMEARQLNFVFPGGLPESLIASEDSYNTHMQTDDTRARARLDEHLTRHTFSEQFNYTNNHENGYLPLSATQNLPSTRQNVGSRYLMVGGNDSWLLGDLSDPTVVTYYGQFRDEPSKLSATHPQAGLANTLDNLFSSSDTGELFGDQGQVSYGPGFTPAIILQKYLSLGANAAKHWGHHDLKVGYDYQYTHVNGTEANALFNQLFGLTADLTTYGPIASGVDYLSEQGGATPADNQIRLRNNYSGMFAQDDWHVKSNVVLNLGVRWDYDSRFGNAANVSPRIGVAWSVFPRTVVHASYGLFYDHFRLGIARDIPGFGGANITSQKYLSFPRLFYGNPSQISEHFNSAGDVVPCASPNLTDAEIAASGATCDTTNSWNTLYGYDHLNSVVTAGHAPVPAGAEVNEQNVQSLTGYTPDAYLAAVAAALGQPADYLAWDPFNHISVHNAFAQFSVPVTVAPGFKTPYTSAVHFGIEQQFAKNLTLEVNYYHRDMNNILGSRATNLTFESREVGESTTYTTGTHKIIGYGPWYDGFYDGLTVELKKRLSHRFEGSVSYTFAKQWDNVLNSNLDAGGQTEGMGVSYSAMPTDSYVGPVPSYTDPATGQNNASAAFIASNGNYIPKVQSNYNGADLDYGPSDLSIPHSFLAYGVFSLPAGFQLSGIFRAQSGFAYTYASANPPDVDGDGLYGGRDLNYIRNSERAPKFVNMDMRVAKTFGVGEGRKLDLYFEMFNLFNNANVAGITAYEPGAGGPPTTTQVLPGREGQVGIRFAF